MSTRRMKRQSDFYGVLTNGEDQVIVRELIMSYVPLHIQEKIIEEYNCHVDRYNFRSETPASS